MALGIRRRHVLRVDDHRRLDAERIAIDSYREMITCVGTDDFTTRKVLEGILAQEEKYAKNLAGPLKELDS
jgi:bacterioferritin